MANKPLYYEPKIATALYDLYHQHPTVENRNELVTYCLPIINGYLDKYLKSYVLTPFPFEEIPDLEQYLALTLILAVEAYDMDKGASLWTYLNARIRFGILDYLKLIKRQLNPADTEQFDPLIYFASK